MLLASEEQARRESEEPTNLPGGASTSGGGSAHGGVGRTDAVSAGEHTAVTPFVACWVLTLVGQTCLEL